MRRLLTGSDSRRTLLYQRAINYRYEELIEIFEIQGDSSTESEESEFEPHNKSKHYHGFLVRRNDQ
jgi:hypothetical protein